MILDLIESNSGINSPPPPQKKNNKTKNKIELKKIQTYKTKTKREHICVYVPFQWVLFGDLLGFYHICESNEIKQNLSPSNAIHAVKIRANKSLYIYIAS